MKTLILGIGNPILSDDAVGIRVAEGLKSQTPALDVVSTGESGLRLLEYVMGYDKLVIIDSVMTSGGKPGELYKLEIEGLKGATSLSLSHGVDLGTMMALGERLGYDMPQQVSVYAVEISDNTTFSEQCTEVVAQRLPQIVEKIAEEEGL